VVGADGIEPPTYAL